MIQYANTELIASAIQFLVVLVMSPQSENSSRISTSRVSEQARQDVQLHNAQRSVADSHSIPVRHLSLLMDGSISASGFFEGLDREQADRSFKHLHEEYQGFLARRGEQPSPTCCTQRVTTNDVGNSNNNSDQNRSVDEISTDERMEEIDANEGEIEETTGIAKEDADQKRYDELEAFWGKRHWRRAFHLFNQYDGTTRLTISVWNQLLSWFWMALTAEHMSNLQGSLSRLRDATSGMANANYVRNVSVERSALQANLIRTYYKVIRSENTQDITHITHRFHLINLYDSHTIYVDEYRGKGMALQVARQRVNEKLFEIFNAELSMTISHQMICHHLKEGRHWYEILHNRETAAFGHGLVVLLPVRNCVTLPRKTGDSIWQFIFTQITSISYRLVELAQALQPIGKALQSKGIGKVHVPLIGYELRSHVSLHELVRSEFNACLARYPHLNISDALRTIAARGRSEDPDQIERLVRQQWEARTLREGEAMLKEAEVLEKSMRRDITRLHHEANIRLKNVAVVETSNDFNAIMTETSTVPKDPGRIIDISDMEDVSPLLLFPFPDSKFK